MITLITGTPGAGKTLYALTEVYPQFEGRTVYVDGVPDLTLNHELPAGEVEGSSTDYSKWLPDGAVLMVDECQRVWRPRSSGSPVPPGVRHMETHRHHGQDLVLITQHPNLLDGNVRRLVGRHLHVRRVWGWNRAIVYEWDQATDPGRTSTATKKTWAYPKSAFGIYKSATVHTARGQKPPFLFMLVLILPLIFGYFAYQAYSSVKARTVDKVVEAPGPGAALAGTGPGAAPPLTSVLPYNKTDFLPVDPIVPSSAPAYDQQRQIIQVPLLSACVSSREKCHCYTQQATRIEVPEAQCRNEAQNPSFDPYREYHPPSAMQKLAQAQAPEQEPPPPRNMGN